VQTLDLNLASRQFKNETLPWVLFVLGVLLVALFSWWNAATFFETRSSMAALIEQEETIKRRLNDLRGRQARAFAEIDRSGVETVLLRTDKANEVIRWKSFSWTRLFNVLQEVQPNDVQMISINPVFHASPVARRRDGIDPDLVPISVEGLCKNLFDFFEFQGNLLADPRIDSVEPDRWSTDEQTGYTSFTMRFLYDPRIDPKPEAEPSPEEGSIAAAQETGGSAPEAPVETATAGEIADPSAELEAGEMPQAGSAVESLAAAPQNKIRRRGRGKGKRAKNNAADDDSQDPSPLPAGALDSEPKMVKPFGQTAEQGQDAPATKKDGGES